MTDGTTKYVVSHRTTYRYRRPVAQSHHVMHLKPRKTERQKVVHHSLLVDPAPVRQSEITDYFGNAATLLRIAEEHSEFIVHARSTVVVSPAPISDLTRSATWGDVAALSQWPGFGAEPDILQFTCASRHVPVSHTIRAFAEPSFPPQRPILAGAMDLTTRIFRDFKFDATATDVSTPIARVLEMRRGVCQDFAHLALAALRALGLPARYVSGYLLTKPPPGQVKLKGSDASHAWLAVWAPDEGWVDFDPTNGLIPSGEHITVAYGRDYEDISPISGVLLGGGEQTMTVAVDVESIE